MEDYLESLRDEDFDRFQESATVPADEDPAAVFELQLACLDWSEASVESIGEGEITPFQRPVTLVVDDERYRLTVGHTNPHHAEDPFRTDAGWRVFASDFCPRRHS